MAEDRIDMERRENGELVLPTIPLRGLTIFPHMVLHFDIGREKSINALEKAMIKNQYVFLSTQKDENTDLPTPDDFYKIGTVAKIKQMLKLPGDSCRVLVEGIKRAEITETLREVPYFKCAVRELEDVPTRSPQRTEALIRAALSAFEEYLNLHPNLSPEVAATVAGVTDPGNFADDVAAHLDIKTDDKQKLLEELDVTKRLMLLNEVLQREIEILRIEQDINSEVKNRINRNQREYYLREQLHAIQDELGYEEDVEDEIDGWYRQMDEIGLPANVREKAEKEIGRLAKMNPSSSEAVVIRTYVETMLSLPWSKQSDSEIDLNKAEAILEADHYGLGKVKERVLEYLAVMQLSRAQKAPILCLVGPPGTGKTSIVRSMAKAIGREYVRMSLGGVRDEAEIRGHRRTYIGAIPGRVINCIKEAGVKNPVFLFDEVDKLGADYKGDPSSALLEVLDPEQNKEFTDHYLEAPFDLSNVVFVTTANDASTIPAPLLDRMEVLEVSGYTEEEKVIIAKEFLMPKKMQENGLVKKDMKISEPAVRDVINYYTRESGVRNLERELGSVCRKVARKIVATGQHGPYSVTGKNLEEYLGKRKYHYDKIVGKTQVGVTTGLAWTVVGGTTLSVETAAMPGTGKVILTGQMGDVMQESAQTGISYIRSIAAKMGIDGKFWEDKDIHIHLPEGAVPKDGPSAGVTMCTAILSTLTGKPARMDVAMTGEITLTGQVLPVGGIREKVLAAHRAGIRKVMLPVDNRVDIDEIPENVREKMEFVLLKRLEDALVEVLVGYDGKGGGEHIAPLKKTGKETAKKPTAKKAPVKKPATKKGPAKEPAAKK